MNTLHRGYINLILFSFCVGLVGVCVKTTQQLDALTIVFYRGAIAATFILVLSLMLGKGRTLITGTAGASMDRRVAGLTLGIGLLQTLALVLYIGALLQTTVTNAAFLHSTAPIFALFFAKIFLKEQISQATYWGILLVMFGTCIIVDPRSLSLSSSEFVGNAMALISGILYGAMVVASKSLSSKVEGFYQAFWPYCIIALLILPFADFGSPLGNSSSPGLSPVNVSWASLNLAAEILLNSGFVSSLMLNWMPLSVLGIVASGLCYIFFVRGIKHVPAQHIMLVAALEPVFGAGIATLYLGEAFSLLTLAGAAMILLGIYWVSKCKTHVSKVTVHEVPASAAGFQLETSVRSAGKNSLERHQCPTIFETLQTPRVLLHLEQSG